MSRAAKPESLVLYIDGAARDNPGPAGIGIVIKHADRIVAEIGEFIGPTTNNVAEYRALLRALEEAKARGARTVEVRSDSELLVKHLKREYKVKSPDLSPLYLEANRLLTSFTRYTVTKIPRGANAAADALANRAIDAANPESAMEFSAIVEPAGVGFFARVPALGIEVEGKTRSEALERARAAILEEVKLLHAAQRPIPKEERIRIRITRDAVE
ncbi:MAG TPA: reverse transcriptase-like protein [bacterium]|nr:reverse transcriptase-like protein [bacterium]